MSKTTFYLTRANGAKEVKDMTARFPGMTKQLADRIRKANAKVGTTIDKIEVTYEYSNLMELEAEYRRNMLEGGEGFMPDFSRDPRLTIKTRTEIY